MLLTEFFFPHDAILLNVDALDLTRAGTYHDQVAAGVLSTEFGVVVPAQTLQNFVFVDGLAVFKHRFEHVIAQVPYPEGAVKRNRAHLLGIVVRNAASLDLVSVSYLSLMQSFACFGIVEQDLT